MSTVDERFPVQAVPATPATGVATQDREGGSRRGTRVREARGMVWELLQTVLLTVAIFVGVRTFVQNFRVEGASMEPTLQTGQLLLINKAAYFHVEGTPLAGLLPTPAAGGAARFLFTGPERGDIAVFQAPPQPDKDFIKRVIGLPGDTIIIRNGQVYVNDTRLDEPYLQFTATYNYPANGQPFTVPPDRYFVLGDNRPNSSDSHVGWTVPVDYLIGKAWVSYWPVQEVGPLPHATYGSLPTS